MFLSNNGNQMLWKSRFAAVIGLGLAVAAAACSGGMSTATSPSGVSPASAATNASCGDTGGLQKFSVSITPGSVTVGANQLTVTVTNDVQSNCNQELGSAQVVVPSGLTVTGVGSFVQTQGKNWASTWASGQTVMVGAQSIAGGGPGSGAAQQKLSKGESVTFTISVMSSVCGINTFAQPTGWAETLADTKSDTYDYVGGALSVMVTGCTACSDPEAPSISHAYFTGSVASGGLGFTANDPRHDDVQKSVAHEQAADKTFHGISPCDHPAFENEVKAYVDGLLNESIPYYHSN
jgi:hypothetical protein